MPRKWIWAGSLIKALVWFQFWFILQEVLLENCKIRHATHIECHLHLNAKIWIFHLSVLLSKCHVIDLKQRRQQTEQIRPGLPCYLLFSACLLPAHVQSGRTAGTKMALTSFCFCCSLTSTVQICIRYWSWRQQFRNKPKLCRSLQNDEKKLKNGLTRARLCATRGYCVMLGLMLFHVEGRMLH